MLGGGLWAGEETQGLTFTASKVVNAAFCILPTTQGGISTTALVMRRRP